METTKTVLIQRDERFQPDGIWVFQDDIDMVYGIVREAYEDDIQFWQSPDNRDHDLDDVVEEFVGCLERKPMCPEAEEVLAENGRDGYLGHCPDAWKGERS